MKDFFHVKAVRGTALTRVPADIIQLAIETPPF
jgi:hypothetical protein